MSGGFFDYNQYHLDGMREQIQEFIDGNVDEHGYDFSEKTLDEFKVAIELLKKTHTYVQRIDWLVSGDDGEESFHKRLKEELDS
jgi:hypothetical protein